MKIMIVTFLILISGCQYPSLEEVYNSTQNLKEKFNYCPELTFCS